MSEMDYVDVEGVGRIKLSNVVEFDCPCGLKAFVGDLPDHPGNRVCVHKEPRCAAFQRLSPLDFIEYCKGHQP